MERNMPGESRQAHSREAREQRLHVGCCSSHFTFIRRHGMHPAERLPVFGILHEDQWGGPLGGREGGAKKR